jgi:hypothetical protein
MSLNLGAESLAGVVKSGIATTGESEKAEGKHPAHKSPVQSSSVPPAPAATSGSSGTTTTGESEKARGKRPAHKAPAQSSSAPPAPAAASGSPKGNGHGTGFRTAPAIQVQASTDAAQAAETRARLIREQIVRLREHDCKHDHWRKDRSGGRCDSCRHDLPFYIHVSILNPCRNKHSEYRVKLENRYAWTVRCRLATVVEEIVFENHDGRGLHASDIGTVQYKRRRS